MPRKAQTNDVQHLMNKISHLEAEKEDLKDALMRTQVSLEAKTPKRESASVDWSVLFPQLNADSKNVTQDSTDGFDSDNDGAVSTECGGHDEAPPVEEGEVHTEDSDW